MLKIGHLQLSLPAVQAALAGYSDAPMRRLARRFGCPYAIHEVVLDKLVVQPGRLQKKLVRIEPDDHPVGGQLMGAEPAQFAAAAEWMAANGYDVIDINFGCPVKKVVGRCRGGFLLSDPPTAIEILKAVRGSVPAAVPVTLKMRRGLDDTPESERNFFTIFDKALELGLASITVHGRTVEQRYIGPSNWEYLARVKRHAGDRVVLGSGDLFDAADAVRMMRETGVDGVSLARGAIGNPWIFREVRALLAGEPQPPPPTVVEQGEVIGEHFELALQAYGEQLAPRAMRRFGVRYSELHPLYKRVRDAFVRAGTVEEWRRVLHEWYNPNINWPPARRKQGPGALIAAGASE